ncbi:exodeoxyribonuclease V subunit alpha [Alcanivorax sp. JB21]|uniref:exodeoxyribonuclease V subunit alpha n=1 Tax=Alcanivorax limicola TaxID=2874102 RepID=UPI001CC141FF|nr:exodeoxyribonuclease V subunit alpha [Alcanivorax limicola]MBZ2188756.1 exodeoxyribonuclease V subunit alpha [Alcanivorax limicola]
MSALRWLEHRLDKGLLRPLDMSLARLVAQHSPDDDEPVWLMALISHLAGQGHVCLDLSLPMPRPFDADDCPWLVPTVAPLADGVIIGAPDDIAPLILEGNRLYLSRHFQAEGRVVHAVRQRCQLRDWPVGLLGSLAAPLFPPVADGQVDWQKVAAINCVLHGFGIITGGPGTGKTWTVTRMLALHLLAAQQHAPLSLPRLRLAAPTGKAAARLTESLRAALADLPLPDALRAAMPVEAVTLHRLLGASRDGRPRYHAGRPLPADVVVVDEASMIDLGLMTQLVAALPDHAALYLVGDRDQLASVEAGSVFADLCGHADTDQPDTAVRQRNRFSPNLFSRLLGESLAGVSQDGQTGLPDDQVVRLEQVHRFDAASGIGRLAEAVRLGDQAAVDALRQAPPANLSWPAPDRAALVEDAITALTPMLTLAARGAPARDVLAAFGRFRLLCAQRRGPLGMETFNALIVRTLRARGLCGPHAWFPGRAVLLTRNDWSQGLFNGDAGVALMDPADGQLKVVFAGADGELRYVPPVRLPDFEDAWAMTIHKSQGSEFDRVLVVLPDSDSPLLGRELLYTAITRARESVGVASTDEVLRLTLARKVRRSSGLAERLRES